jgi:hypothetical protein
MVSSILWPILWPKLAVSITGAVHQLIADAYAAQETQ